MIVLKHCLLLIATISTLTILAPGAQAEKAQESQSHVAIEVVPEFHTVKAGDTLFVAIRQKLAEGWHSYWRNPGDSGEPPRFDWSLPDGFVTGRLHWPVPEKIASGPLTSFGYEGSPILLQEIRIPDPLPPGPLELKVDIDILVCSEICIPETHEASFILNGKDAKDQKESELIDEAYVSMPIDVDWPSSYYTDGEDNFILDQTIEMPRLITAGNERIKFDVLPFEWGMVENSAKTQVSVVDQFQRIVLRKQRGNRPLDKIGETGALIVYENMDTGEKQALNVKASPDPEWLASIKAQRTQTQKKTEPAAENEITPPPPAAPMGLLLSAAFALLGGLILNLMPCVFPILSMKALGLVKMAEKSPGLARAHGLAYTAGILLSFAILAALLIALKAGGAQIGWGFQLQNPLVVLTLSWLLLLVGFNLSGFIELGSSLANLGGKWIDRHALAGTFLTGVLATVVATPCTAPFMAAAIGYALTQPALVSLPVFLALGFGLALPYLLLSFFPSLRSALPKPGPWMQRFRECLAFPMYASAMWLVWVYSLQVGSLGMLYALLGMVGIAFAVWLLRNAPATGKKKAAIRTLALAVLIFVLLSGIAESGKPHDEIVTAQVETAADETELLEPFTKERYTELKNGDGPLFINMTAAWCITCKVNERTALSTKTVKDFFARNGILTLKGDWTNQNPEITEYLQAYGRNGVPIYVYYGPRDPATGKRPEPVVLPQILTTGIILTTLEGEK